MATAGLEASSTVDPTRVGTRGAEAHGGQAAAATAVLARVAVAGPVALARAGNAVAVRASHRDRSESDGWRDVGQFGYVRDPPVQGAKSSSTGGANLRAGPSTDAELLIHLPFGARVHIVRAQPAWGWYQVRVQDPGEAAGASSGFVASHLIWMNPPDPAARLYAIQPGDGLQAVVERHRPYQGYVRTGDDARSLAMAVYLANATDPRTAGSIRLDEDKLAEARADQGVLDALDEYRRTLGPIFQSVELVGADPGEKRKIWLPGRAYVDGLKASGVMPQRAGWKNTAIAVAKGIGGFAVGMVEGFVKSIVDVFVGIYDLIKSLVGLIVDLVTGAALAAVRELIDTIRDLSIDDLRDLATGVLDALAGFVVGALDDFLTSWNQPGPYNRWRFRGKVIGYVLAEALMLFFTGATANAAKWLGKLGKVGGKLASIFRKVGGRLADLRPRRAPDVDLPRRRGRDRKSRELPFAVASAATISEANDDANRSIPALLTALQPLRAKFRWIKRFSATRTRPGHFRIALVASDHTVDRDYTPGADDTEASTVRSGGPEAVASLGAEFAEVVARRPRLAAELVEIERLAAVPGSGATAARRAEAMGERLRRLSWIDENSAAPRDLPVVEVSARRADPNHFDSLGDVGGIAEFPDGSRAWRDPQSNAIRHESTLGPSSQRAHTEGEYYARTGHGNLPPGPRYERAHSLGQGTGFESPFGIRYAPRYVNQSLQNHGIEKYLRRLASSAGPGESFRVLTNTTTHAGSLRLRGIDYRIQRVVGGQVTEFASYSIRVGGTAANPVVQAARLRFGAGAEVVARARSVRLPSILQRDVSRSL